MCLDEKCVSRDTTDLHMTSSIRCGRRQSIRQRVPSYSGQSQQQQLQQQSTPAAQVQLLTIPQLDVIQRALKILDVRLQHIQTHAKNEDNKRQDIQHIRTVMCENQKALTTIVTVLTSIQEEITSLASAIKRQQANTFHIQVPHSARQKSIDSRQDIT